MQNARSDPPTQVSVYELTARCSQSFEELLQLLSKIKADAFDAAETQLGRLNIWTSNVGALANKNASLDYRLRSSHDIKEMILQLLQVMDRNLRRAIKSALEINNHCLAKESYCQSCTDLAPSLTESVEATKESIDRLQTLAMVLRKSSIQSRNIRAKAFASEDDDESFELFALTIIKHRYKEINGSLCEQLAASLAIRRRRFEYKSRHQSKLAYNNYVNTKDSRVAEHASRQLAQPRQTQKRIQPSELPAKNIMFKQELQPIGPAPSQTNASTLDSKAFRRILYDSAAKSPFSVISRGTSIHDAKLDYPPPPIITRGHNECTCPYCFELLPAAKVKNDRWWRHHVDADLEAYVCISERCSSDPVYFSKFEEWSQHMAEHGPSEVAWNVHLLMWRCPICNPIEPFRWKNEFKDHMNSFHADRYTQSQVSTLTRRSTVSAIRDPFTCPLCNCIPEEIEHIIPRNRKKRLDLLPKHIAGHLKSLAFMSLPYRDDINNTLSEASRAPSRGLHWTGKSMQEQSSIDSDLARLSLSFSDDENLNKQELGAARTILTRELGTQSPPGIEVRDIEWNFLPIKVYPDAEKDPILQPFIISRNGSSITSTANRVQPEDNNKDYSINFELQFTPAFKPFVGRHALWQIEEALRPQHEDHASVCVLYGNKGNGKTCLALEFARQHRKEYTAVFWIDGSTEKTVAQSIENIKSRLPGHQRLEKNGNLNSPPSTGRQEAIDDVLIWLCQKGNNRWLMIFDNVDHDAYDAWEYIPKADHGFVLVTTRSSYLVNIGVNLGISAMDLGQSIDMLHLTSGRNMSDYSQLALRLYCHPLALVLAGSFFRQHRITQEKYLELCGQTLDGTSNLLALGHRSHFSITSTLQVSLNQARNSNPNAAFLLELWSCLSKTDLWFELLSPALKEINGIPGWLRSLASDNFSFLDAMQTLLDYSLAECHENGGGYTMHPVIHEWCFDQLQNKQEMTSLAIIVLGNAVPSTHSQEYWALQRRLLPHLDRTQSLVNGIPDFQIPENLSGLMSVCFHKIEDVYADQNQMAEATQAARHAVTCLPVYHPDRAKCLNNLGLKLGYQFSHTMHNLYLDDAIHVTRQAISITPDKHPDQAGQLDNLGCHLFEGYLYYMDKANLKEAIQAAREAISITPNDHPDLAGRLNNLGTYLFHRYRHTKVTTDLEEVIQVTRQAVNTTPDDDPDLAGRLNNLGNYLFDRYRYTNAMTDLEKVIQVTRRAVNATPNNHPHLAERLKDLGLRLWHRYLRTRAMTDLEEATSCHTLALHQITPNIIVRIEAGRNVLMTAAEALDWKQAYEAWSLAVRLALEFVPFSPKYFDKLQRLGRVSDLASDAAVAALNSQQPPIVSLRLLEQGLCLVAAPTDKMFVDIFNLQEADSILAEKFFAVRNKLKSLTMGDRTTTQTNRPSWQLRADECRKEDEKFYKLIAEIRDKDGFENFLDAPSLEEMQAAATSGPIAVINVSSYRCDAILVEMHQIRVLKLPSLNREEIEAKANNADLRSPEILQWLWDTVTEPILDALGYIDCPSSDKWPHIWWIPTGPLTTFPLHAAGYHDRASGQTVIDRVMSSYSPSTKAIIQSRRRQASSTAKKAVLVAAERGSLLYGNEEVEKIRERCQTMSLTPVVPTQSTTNVISHLLQCKIFHFTGTIRGYPNYKNNLSSIFANLFELNLRKSPPFFAYLSMCGADPSCSTQNIDLIRKCQLTGFRHVIGTLWNMTETGVNMATIIYDEMRDSNMTDESVCRGLHNASRTLRDRWLTTLETGNGSERASTQSPSWIPYVHYGV